jgi:hypothetical protein
MTHGHKFIPCAYVIQGATHAFIEQLLARVLQAFPTLLDASPFIQHAGNLGIDQVDVTD